MNAPSNAALTPPAKPGQPAARLPGIPIDDPRHVLAVLYKYTMMSSTFG